MTSDEKHLQKAVAADQKAKDERALEKAEQEKKMSQK